MFDNNFGVNLNDSEKEFLKYYCSLTEQCGDSSNFPMSAKRGKIVYKTLCKIVHKLTSEELQKLNGFFDEIQMKNLESIMQEKTR